MRHPRHSRGVGRSPRASLHVRSRSRPCGVHRSLRRSHIGRTRTRSALALLAGRRSKRPAPTGNFTCMPNIYRPVFEEGERPEGFRSKRARIGYELGTELIGCSLWELAPGEAAYPYHFHFADEELLIVISGCPTLRTPDGLRELDEGEAVRFPLGGDG